MAAVSAMTGPAGIRNGMPEFRPYRYRGTGEDTLTPPGLQALLDAEPDLPDAPWSGRELAPCGTAAAARRHRRHREEACADCLQAEARQAEARRAERRDYAGQLAARRERRAIARQAGLSPREVRRAAHSPRYFRQVLAGAS